MTAAAMAGATREFQDLGQQPRCGRGFGEVGQRMSGGQEYLLVDSRGGTAQETLEQAGKRERVVHLVGVVRATGRDYRAQVRDVVGVDFGVGGWPARTRWGFSTSS